MKFERVSNHFKTNGVNKVTSIPEIVAIYMSSENTCLNPTKCAFVLGTGKFVGYMVSWRGIEVNPKKIKAIMEMRSPKCHKGVQSWLVARLRFRGLSLKRQKSAFHSLTYWKIRRTQRRFYELQNAFQAIKRYLSSPSLLVRSIPGDPL